MAMTRAEAFCIASRPWEYRLRSVSAAAMPLGKASCSWVTSCRLRGMARKTPRAAVRSTKGTSTVQGLTCSEVASGAAMSSRAPKAVPTVAPVE